MNSSYYQNQINRLEKDIADLQKKIADENKKEIDKNKQIDSVHRTINKNTSISTLNSRIFLIAEPKLRAIKKVLQQSQQNWGKKGKSC